MDESTQPGASAGLREVDRVVCASVATSTEGAFAQMEAIRVSSLRHNEPLGLNAVLLYLSGWFLLWLEGPPEELRHTLRRVARDPRHWSPQLVHFSHGPRLLRDPWSMMLVPSPAKGTEIAERVMRMREEMRQGRQYSPLVVLRRLATPLRLPSGVATDTDAFHRVGVCAADPEHGFAVARLVAHDLARETLHRRVADQDGREAGFETVDFQLDSHPCRINALPWQGLQQGLLRLYLAEWRYLLLIFGGSRRADDALMDRVCKLVADVPGAPPLLGTAPDAQAHELAADTARLAGVSYKPIATCRAADTMTIWEALAGELRALGAPGDSVYVSQPAGLPPDLNAFHPGDGRS
ncbi:MAG: BLUF domain-containing protein [Burkholderiales bacterium]|nr:BLUF domain-containing protein [Burkholderiales bacterium]